MFQTKICLQYAFLKAAKLNLPGRQAELLLAFRDGNILWFQAASEIKHLFRRKFLLPVRFTWPRRPDSGTVGGRAIHRTVMEANENIQCLHRCGLCSHQESKRLPRASYSWAAPCMPSTAALHLELHNVLQIWLLLLEKLTEELQPCFVCNQPLIWVPVGLWYYTGQYGHLDTQENQYDIHMDYF